LPTQILVQRWILQQAPTITGIMATLEVAVMAAMEGGTAGVETAGFLIYPRLASIFAKFVTTMTVATELPT